MTNLRLYAEFEALPGMEGRVAVLLAAYRREVRAEPGNRCFGAHQLRDAPGRFFVYEEYLDAAAVAAHLAAPANEEFNTSLAPLVVGGGSTLTWLTEIAETSLN